MHQWFRNIHEPHNITSGVTFKLSQWKHSACISRLLTDSTYRHSVRSSVYATTGCPSVRLSVCPSVTSFARSRNVRRVCCLAPYRREISIDFGGRRPPGAQQQRHNSTGCCTALSSKCEQCHIYSWRRKLDSDLFIDRQTDVQSVCACIQRVGVESAKVVQLLCQRRITKLS